MSKSDENVNSFITVLDDPDTVLRKFKRAVTDSEALVRYDPENKPGVSNLVPFTPPSPARAWRRLRRSFSGKGYGDFKPAVAEAVIEELRPIQERFRQLAGTKLTWSSVTGATPPKPRGASPARPLPKVMKEKVGGICRCNQRLPQHRKEGGASRRLALLRKGGPAGLAFTSMYSRTKKSAPRRSHTCLQASISSRRHGAHHGHAHMGHVEHRSRRKFQNSGESIQPKLAVADGLILLPRRWRSG